jgi:hypothetical protein
MVQKNEIDAVINLVDVLLDSRTELDEDIKEGVILLLTILGNYMLQKQAKELIE